MFRSISGLCLLDAAHPAQQYHCHMSPGNPTPEYLRDAQGTERKILAPGPSRPRSFSHQNLSIFFLFFFLFKLISMPNVGLRLTTWRSRVPCLTHRTSQHPRILAIFFFTPSSPGLMCPQISFSVPGHTPPSRGLPTEHHSRALVLPHSSVAFPSSIQPG